MNSQWPLLISKVYAWLEPGSKKAVNPVRPPSWHFVDPLAWEHDQAATAIVEEAQITGRKLTNEETAQVHYARERFFFVRDNLVMYCIKYIMLKLIEVEHGTTDSIFFLEKFRFSARIRS